jgi:hypothetical protein
MSPSDEPGGAVVVGAIVIVLAELVCNAWKACVKRYKAFDAAKVGRRQGCALMQYISSSRSFRQLCSARLRATLSSSVSDMLIACGFWR